MNIRNIDRNPNFTYFYRSVLNIFDKFLIILCYTAKHMAYQIADHLRLPAMLRLLFEKYALQTKAEMGKNFYDAASDYLRTSSCVVCRTF